jgi:TrmH family RNA methyltransferase
MSHRPSADLRPLSKAEVKQLRSLTTKKGRETSESLLIEGWRSVEELLSSSWTVDRVVVDLQRLPPQGPSVLRRCAERSVEVRSGNASDLRALSDVREDQGIIAVARLPHATMKDVPERGDVLVLDAVADPGNVGTLIRTADWFGLTCVVLGPGCASLGNPKVVRSTMGSLFHLVAIEVDDLQAACRSLVDQGVVLASAEVEGGAWPRWAPRERVAVILGSEAHGVSPAVRDLAPQRVSIPRGGRAESLNVAAAGAIVLSSLSDQRHA